MPFELFGHRVRSASVPGTAPADARPDASGAPADGVRTAPFAAFTEEARIVGRIRVDGRLSDALNRRAPIPVYGTRLGPLELPDLAPAPELAEIDPYDLVVVTAGPDSQPELPPERRAALRSRRTRYDVCCEVPGGVVCGTVHLHPGTVPGDLLGHRPELFVAVTDADVRIGNGTPDAQLDVAFVNRTYLRTVVPLDEARVEVERRRAAPSVGDSGTVGAS